MALTLGYERFVRESTDVNGNTVLVGGDGIPVPLFGQNLVTVGASGQYATLEEAVTAVGSRWVVSKQMPDYVGPWPDKNSFVATFTNGSASFTKVSGDNFGTFTSLVGQEFILVGDKYYRVKACGSTTGTLFGPFKGVTGNFTCTPLLLDWVTILLLPGAHSAYGVQLAPGTCLAGLSKESTTLVEDGSGAPFHFAPMTSMSNLALEPSPLFGSMDRLTLVDGISTGDLMPYGCTIFIDKSRVACANERGPHAGGNLTFPVVTGGLSVFSNSELVIGSNHGNLGGGGETGLVSRVVWQNVRSRFYKGQSQPSRLSLLNDVFAPPDGPITVDVVDCHTDFSDIGATPSSAEPLTIFYFTDPLYTVNIVGGKHVLGTTLTLADTKPSYAVRNTGATINIEGGAVIECTGATTTVPLAGVAVYNDGGTTNIRTGARVRGDTDAIVCASGTVNLSPNADAINGTSGAGTINAIAT